MVNCQFKPRNAENNTFKGMLYISPDTVPNTSNGSVVVGNAVTVAVGGSNQDPVVQLIPAPYKIIIATKEFDTAFNIDITYAPTSSVVQAIDYLQEN